MVVSNIVEDDNFLLNTCYMRVDFIPLLQIHFFQEN